MSTLLQRVLSSGPFMPHGHCYLWTPELVWLHVISDGLITLAYYSIPITLAWFVRQRHDFDFRGLFVCFGVFILACGTTHLLEVWNVWHGNYWLSGVIKAFTAAASIVTAILLVRLMPQALALPSPATLAQTNFQLEGEIRTRRAAQTGLSKLNAELEERVAKRTQDLQAANAELERQMLARTEVDARVLWMASIPEQNPNPIAEFERRSGALRYANPAAFHTFSELERDGLGHRWLGGVRELVGDWTDGTSRTALHEAVFGDAFFLLNVTFNAATDRVRIYGSDITKRKHAESVAARLAAIVEFSADAIMGKDLESTVTSWNAGAEKMFGYTAAEMVGQSMTCLIPMDRQEEENQILTCVRRGESVEAFETRRKRKDGQLIDVSVTVSPIRDSEGQIIGGSKVARDITERKQGEAALREREEHFQTMVNAIPQLAWTADADGSLNWYNERWYQYTGTTPAQMEQWGWQSVPDPAMLLEVTAAWQEALDSSQPFEMEFPLRGANGEFRTFLTLVQPLKDAAGKVVQWFGTNTDVDTLRKARQEVDRLNAELERRVVERTAQLEAANKELEAFSYSVSHDLRAPLRAVDGFSQAVVEDYGAQLPADGRRQLQVIRESAQQMGQLVDDLLSFSRLSRQPLHCQTVQVEQLVQEVLATQQAECLRRNVRITVGALPPCQGDRALLQRVWINLLSNALKYSSKREHPTLEIGCLEQDDQHVYFVRDNGTGFDMRYAGKLFGVFHRLHRAEDYEGTGVGLAIVQRVIHRHGGRVWAQAEVDRGATFFFTVEGAIKT